MPCVVAVAIVEHGAFASVAVALPDDGLDDDMDDDIDDVGSATII